MSWRLNFKIKHLTISEINGKEQTISLPWPQGCSQGKPLSGLPLSIKPGLHDPPPVVCGTQENAHNIGVGLAWERTGSLQKHESVRKAFFTLKERLCLVFSRKDKLVWKKGISEQCVQIRSRLIPSVCTTKPLHATILFDITIGVQSKFRHEVGPQCGS